MISRRAALKISVGAVFAGAMAAYRPSRQVWTGHGFGTEVKVTLVGPRAEAVFRAVEAEIERLENVFSLFHRQAAISRLNRDGYLLDPPADLVALLGLSRRLWAASGGVFDPTVQGVWARNRAPVGLQHVEVGAQRIRIAHQGMAITLNGVAQGYASDRIAQILRRHGYGAHLVDLGEFVAGDETARLGIENDEGRVLARVPLTNRAQATSSPGALQLADGRSHILHPDGLMPFWKTVSVQARTAALADGFSTALALMPLAHIERLDLAKLGLMRIWLEAPGGQVRVVSA